MYRLVVQPHHLFCLQSNHGVRFAVVIAELNLVDARSPGLYHGANLAADQTMFGQVL